MTTQTEALELALEALTHGGCPPDCKDGMTDSGGVHPWGEAALIPCPNCQTITAIKEALAQLEPDPVAWMVWGENNVPSLTFKKPSDKYVFDSLYITPPQRPWVGLTDEEHMILYTEADGGLRDWARAIEAKLKQKNGYAEEKKNT